MISFGESHFRYQFSHINQTGQTPDEGYHYVLVDWESGHAEPVGQLKRNILGGTSDGLVTYDRVYDRLMMYRHRF